MVNLKDQSRIDKLQACPLSDDQKKDVWPTETNLKNQFMGEGRQPPPDNPIHEICRTTDLTKASRTQKTKKKKKKEKKSCIDPLTI